MKNIINIAIEYNEEGAMAYLTDFPGAFTRGLTKDICLNKVQKELMDYLQWRNNSITTYNQHIELLIIQEQYSKLQISDADTDIIFTNEKIPITKSEYYNLKALVLKSAYDFKTLYSSIPDKNFSVNKTRKTFYGCVPNSPKEMYAHTNEVTNFYLNGLNLKIESTDDILADRISAFESIEKNLHLLNNDPLYIENEIWTLSKVIRRFIWHDRIHAKAMYKLAAKKWKAKIINNFQFKI